MMLLLTLLNILLVLLVLAITIYGFYGHYLHMRAKKLMPELPYPDGIYPLVGHTVWLFSAAKNSVAFRLFMANYGRYYEDGFHYLIGHRVVIYVMNHTMLQESFRSVDLVDKSHEYKYLEILTEGASIAPGIKWKKLRKVLNQTFSLKQMDAYMDTLNDYIQDFVEKEIKKYSLENKFSNIQHHLMDCFSCVLTKTHFGVDVSYKEYSECASGHIVMKMIEDLIEVRFFRPYLHPDFVFKFHKLYKEILQLKVPPDNFITQLILRRLQLLQQNNYVKEDHQIYLDQVPAILKELNIEPDINTLLRNSNDIFLAGSDSTSVTAAAILYYLSLYEEIQDKVYKEVSSYYVEDSNRRLTRADIKSMTYLDMVMNETIRICCPPGVVRFVPKDTNVGICTLPKGASLYISMMSQHQNPKYYEKPFTFYPEHFTPEAVRERPRMAFIPFSSGPRSCPGKAFSYLMVKSMIAPIINKYQVETNLPLEEVKLKFILMAEQVQGYPIRFTPRHPDQSSTSNTPILFHSFK